MDVSILFILGALDWVIRIGALLLIPKNRKPSSATAWIMLVLLLPFIGILIFWLVGSPKLNKNRRQMQKQMDKIKKSFFESPSMKRKYSQLVSKNHLEKYQPFINLNNNLGGMPAFKNNDIELIEDYYKAINQIAEDIKNANEYVSIEYFIIVMDKTTEVLFEEMEKAVSRGVKIRLLYDTLGSRGYPNMKSMKKRLTEIGVEWQPMLPLKKPGKSFNRPDLRNHRKIVVVDGKIGYTGSQNLITRNYHRKDELYYDELVVRVTGPVVLQLQLIFATDWFSETGNKLHEENALTLNQSENKKANVLAQFLPSGPGFDDDNNLKLFTALIHSAKKKIIIVNPYFVPEDSLTTAITSAAQRNVDVVMINSQIMDQKFVGNAQRSYFEQLLEAGVKIYQYKLPVLLHSKYIVVDDEICVIGSSNLDMRSFTLNLEVTLVTYDRNVAKSFMQLSNKYLRKSNELKLETWKQRPLRTKLFENLARLTAAFQ